MISLPLKQEVLLAALPQTKSLYSAHLPVCTIPVQGGASCIISAGFVVALIMWWGTAAGDTGQGRAGQQDLRTEGPLRVELRWAELPLSAQR